MAWTYWRRYALAVSLALASTPAAAVAITITVNTNWSAINTGTGPGGQPSAADTITVKAARTLTVDVTNGVVGAMFLGGIAPSAGTGTLTFSAATSQVTISTASGQTGTLTLGATGNAGNLNMTNGGTLTLVGFVSTVVGTFTRNATPTVGTVILTGTNTLPSAAAYNTFNNLTVSANTTTQAQALTIGGNLVADGTFTVNNALTVNGTTSVGGTLSVISATGVKTFVGAVTLNSGSRWCFASTLCSAATPVGGNIFIQGNFSDGATTFISGSGNYTFNGTAAQTLTGTSGGSTSFAIFILNNANGLTLTDHNLTVTTLLTLAAGKITTGANTVYVSNGSAIGAGAGRFIEGNLKKPFSAGNLTRSFEVGGNTGANYSPVSITFASVTTGGDVTVSTTAGTHTLITTANPLILDPAADVNRWWSITNNSVVGTTYSATFTYVTVEIDGGGNCAVATSACPAAFIAVRHDGTDWNATTLSTTPTTTALTISAETGFGAFAIGEAAQYNINRGTVGRFNAYDPPPVTATNSIQGFIRTKTAGTAFTLRIVHMDTSGLALQNVNKDTIRVELVDASNTGGTYTNNCSNAWTSVIATVNTAFPSNTDQLDVTFTGAALVTNSYPSVRVKVTRTSGGTDTGCSGDRFAIRPANLVLEALDSTWQTAGVGRALDTAGGRVHASSTAAATTPRPFTLRATARNSAANPTTNYAGALTKTSGSPTCVLPSGCTTGTLDVDTPWSALNGVVTTTAHYSEVGTFNLLMEDRTFASVDAVDTALAVRTIPQQGSPTPLLVGRFVPDRFTLTPTVGVTPQLQTFGSSCASRSFTYIGQPFWFGTFPSATLSAVNAGGGVTVNYALNTGTSKPALVETFADAGAPAGAPLNTAQIGTPGPFTGSGTATYSSSAAGTLSYTRHATTPTAPFNAAISLSVGASDSTESAVVGNGVISTAAPMSFSPIAFDSGTAVRYGLVRLLDVFGPLTGNAGGYAPVGIQAQYWSGSAFVINSADNCTTFIEKNFVLDSHTGAITAANLPTPTAGSNGKVSMGVGTLSSGVGRVHVISPTTAITSPGRVRICLDLDSTSTPVDNTCVAPTPANNAYLQGRWAATGNYDRDPSAGVGFGLFGAQPRNFIYFRENY